MRVLVLGARGQLGQDCVSVLQGIHEVVACDLPDVDVTNIDSTASCVAETTPDAIVNCAAFTQVDEAESVRQQAHAVNAGGAQCVAELAREHGAYLVHISTDYVFGGQRPPPQPYLETDEPGPVNWYGRTKLAGEQAVAEVGPRHAILRSAWLYGRHGRNFLRAVLQQALRDPRRPLWVVADQHGCPTWSRRLALQIARLIAAQPEGLFHAVAAGHTTWYDLAVRFLQLMGLERTVERCATKDRPSPAARPMNSILGDTRLAAAGLFVMRPWEEDLEEFVQRHGAELVEEIRSEPA